MKGSALSAWVPPWHDRAAQEIAARNAVSQATVMRWLGTRGVTPAMAEGFATMVTFGTPEATVTRLVELVEEEAERKV